MGCFLGCFGSFNVKKRRHRGNNCTPSGAKDQLLQQKGYDSVKQVVYPGESLRAVLGDKIKPIEQAGCLNQRKWESPVGLISVVQNRDEGVDELRDGLNELGKEVSSTEKEDLVYLSGLDPRSVEKSAEKLGSEGNKEIFDPVVVTNEPPENSELLDEDFTGKGKTESLAKSITSNSLSEIGSSNLRFVSYPPSHRYQNCRESDDEQDDLDYDDSDIDVGDGETEDGEYRDADELSDSVYYPHGGDDCNQSSMLNPVENLLQWKALKARGKRPLQSQDKNSVFSSQEMPSGSHSSEHNVNQVASIRSKTAYQEQQVPTVAIDASLSNWLPSTETKDCQNVIPPKTMSQSSISPKNLEDRRILGALTVDEFKLMSTEFSPRNSPTKSPDDMAIIASVGWSSQETGKDSSSTSSYKGIPNTTSKYREDKRVNWHSTPFETRLEKALSRESARA